MFTGIIKTRSCVVQIDSQPDNSLTVVCELPANVALQLGTSLAINGVCLTVTQIETATFAVDIMPETYRRTSLKHLRVGDEVNLEPALTLRDPLDGHLVLGHVDHAVKLFQSQSDGNSVRLTFELPAGLAAFVALKGSVAIDGTSLTVTAVTVNTFTVNLIPYTAQMTGLLSPHWESQYNLEVDVLARYLQRAKEVAE